ncbi:MAG: type I-C CRISPR-associated endonuclease Cas1c [Christensenella sp.]
MRKLLNVLYVTTPKSYLALDGENVVVLLEENEKFRLPITILEGIVCFGYMGVSPALMGKCVNQNIPISFMKPNGEFLAKLCGKTQGNVLLRKSQYAFSDDDRLCIEFAQNTIAAKLANSCFVLDRSIRDSKDEAEIEQMQQIYDRIAGQLEKIYDIDDPDELRGFEGIMAKYYFGTFDNMITQQKKDFYMYERSKRPPLDNLNCCLSYLYSILALEIVSALETVGLDPYVGFFHQLRPGRASLALDLEEELRAYFVDRLVISMVNLKQILPGDFMAKEGGGVLFTEDGRKKILLGWQNRKKKEIFHSVIGEKIELGLLPYVQAQLLAKYLRHEISEYPPFLCK